MKFPRILSFLSILKNSGVHLSLPLASPLDAQALAILISIPDQQFTAWPDDLAGSVEDLNVILKGHQVLLIIVPGAAYIPGITSGKRKEITGSKFPPLIISTSSSMPNVYGWL